MPLTIIQPSLPADYCAGHQLTRQLNDSSFAHCGNQDGKLFDNALPYTETSLFRRKLSTLDGKFRCHWQYCLLRHDELALDVLKVVKLSHPSCRLRSGGVNPRSTKNKRDTSPNLAMPYSQRVIVHAYRAVRRLAYACAQLPPYKFCCAAKSGK